MKRIFRAKVFTSQSAAIAKLIVLHGENSYRVIHKSLQDFRPLRYSSRDSHAEAEHVNRGRDTSSFFPNIQVLDMPTLGDAADVNSLIKFLPHTCNVCGVTIPATVPQRSEFLEGLMNYPIYILFMTLRFCFRFVFVALMEYCLVNIVLGDSDGPKRAPENQKPDKVFDLAARVSCNVLLMLG